MINKFTRLLPIVAALTLSACANVQLDATSASPVLLEKLRTANLGPAQVGNFGLAPGKDPSMDTKLDGLRGSSLAPAKGRWSQLLKDTVTTELSAAGLIDAKSPVVIEGLLTDSRIDAAISTGTGRLAARFKVTKNGQVAFDKELVADASWESSFLGAVAIPAAINQYGALYKTLVGKLFDDPDFRRALGK